MRSLTCWTEPLHFQFPPTKNLRASSADEEWKPQRATVVDLAAEDAASLAAA